MVSNSNKEKAKLEKRDRLNVQLILQDVFGIVSEAEDVIQEFKSEKESIELSKFLMGQYQIDFSQNKLQSQLYSVNIKLLLIN